MADIFVSYARADKARVAPLVAALEAQGWSVWWDPAIIPGQEFDDRIAEEIDKASAVVVVWSPASVASRWVRGEAREAADRGILVPVRFDNARLPIDARGLHTTDLDNWKEDRKNSVFLELVNALSLLLKDRPRKSAAASERPQTSICVLPFVNMSGDPEQEYFSDGISEDIITDLSKVSALSVIARNSAFTFKGKSVDIKEVARQLGVSHVLEGSVRKSGNKVRITAQLIDGAANNHVWAERYDRDLSDIFALQDDISQAIVAALKVRLFPEEKKAIENRGTDNVEAYDLYLRAQDLSRQFGLDQSHRAIDIYRRAIALDPKFALAWAGLGIAYANIVIRVPQEAKSAFKEMDAAFCRTAELAPDSPIGPTAESFRLSAHHDWVGAEKARAAAVALGSARELSGLPGGNEYTFFLSHVGRMDDAVRYALINRTTDPLSLATSSTLQYMLDGAGRHDEAETEYNRSLDLTGDRTTAEYWALLRAWELGRPELIAERTRKHLSASAYLFGFYPDLAKVMDDPAAALALIRAACQDPQYQDPSRMSILAHWAAHYSDIELALAALRRAFVELKGITVGNLWFPAQKQTRRLPGFKQLARDLGLDNYWRKTGQWGDFVRPLGNDDFEIIR